MDPGGQKPDFPILKPVNMTGPGPRTETPRPVFGLQVLDCHRTRSFVSLVLDQQLSIPLVDSQRRFSGTVVSLVRSSAGRSCRSSVARQLMLAPESCFTGLNLYWDWTRLDPGPPVLLCRTVSPLSQVRVSSSAGYTSDTWQVKVDSVPGLRWSSPLTTGADGKAGAQSDQSES